MEFSQIVETRNKKFTFAKFYKINTELLANNDKKVTHN